MVLPNLWLWDMVDEFVYQFQSFQQYRCARSGGGTSGGLPNELPAGSCSGCCACHSSHAWVAQTTTASIMHASALRG